MTMTINQSSRVTITIKSNLAAYLKAFNNKPVTLFRQPWTFSMHLECPSGIRTYFETIWKISNTTSTTVCMRYYDHFITRLSQAACKKINVRLHSASIWTEKIWDQPKLINFHFFFSRGFFFSTFMVHISCNSYSAILQNKLHDQVKQKTYAILKRSSYNISANDHYRSIRSSFLWRKKFELEMFCTSKIKESSRNECVWLATPF